MGRCHQRTGSVGFRRSKRQAAGELSEECPAQIRTVGQRVREDLQQIGRSNPTPGGATTPQTTPSTETIDNGGNSGGNDAQVRRMTRPKTAASTTARARSTKGEPRTAAGLYASHTLRLPR
jgi:hypothetical protein